MISRWDAWVRMLPIWVPAVLLSVASIGLYWWQTSTGTGALLTRREQELRDGLKNLQETHDQAQEQRQKVSELNLRLQDLYEQGFGRLEERLINILREVGSATRNAGLLPRTYSYSAKDDTQLQFTRFSVVFGVTGRYAQVRQMLAELQQSSELLLVDRLSLTGEEEIASEELMISIQLSTYLNEADQEKLEELNQRLQLGGGEDG
jgi:Tfp pilus assembly protein PilO